MGEPDVAGALWVRRTETWRIPEPGQRPVKVVEMGIACAHRAAIETVPRLGPGHARAALFAAAATFDRDARISGACNCRTTPAFLHHAAGVALGAEVDEDT